MEAFNFRIIKTKEGTEVIDTNLTTPFSALTPMQMLEYIRVEDSLSFLERKRKQITKNNKLLHKIDKLFRKRVFAWNIGKSENKLCYQAIRANTWKQNNCVNLNLFWYGMDSILHDAKEVILFIWIGLPTGL